METLKLGSKGDAVQIDIGRLDALSSRVVHHLIVGHHILLCAIMTSNLFPGIASCQKSADFLREQAEAVN